MDASQNGRFRLSISLDADAHAFVEKFMSAGVFQSRDELIAMALAALSREIEASARNAIMEAGCEHAEDASLEDLADMLFALDHSRMN